MSRKAGMGMLGTNREVRITQVEQLYRKPSRKEVLMKELRNQRKTGFELGFFF